jgi:hypothetical protein
VSSEKIKVADRDDVVRDANSGAILNTDLARVNEYKKRKIEINKIKQLENKMNSIESDVRDIKSILQILLERK